ALVQRQPFAVRRKQHDKIPVEYVDIEVFPAPHHGIEEITQRLGQIIIWIMRTAANEFQATVDIPRHNQHRMPGLLDRFAKRMEIVSTIYEKCDTVSLLYTPAIDAGLENRRAGHRLIAGSGSPLLHLIKIVAGVDTSTMVLAAAASTSCWKLSRPFTPAIAASNSGPPDEFMSSS